MDPPSQSADKAQIEDTLAILYREMIDGGRIPTTTSFKKYIRTNARVPVPLKSIKSFILRSAISKFAQPRSRRILSRSNKMTANEVGNLQGDLLILTRKDKNANSGVSALLIMVDIFSKFLFISPLKRKSTSEVLKGLESVVESSPFVIHCLNFDGESAISGSVIKSFLRKNNIKLIQTKKCYVVENIIRTLKRQIAQYQEASASMRFLSFLPSLANALNNEPRLGGGTYSPSDAVRNPSLVQPPTSPTYHPPKFRVMDIVQRHVKKPIFAKESQFGNWSRDKYMITHIDIGQPLPMYGLVDVESGDIVGEDVNEAELKSSSV